MSECLICKNHYTQGGKCHLERKNCLLFEEEPRGKMLRGKFQIDIFESEYAETPILKYGSKIRVDDNGICVDMTVIKVNWINLRTGKCRISADYHEKEMPRCEKKKKIFKVVKE